MFEQLDPILDFFDRDKRQLDSFFAPKRVAVIGATEAQNSVGRTVMANLLATPFGGEVFPVNPKRSSVLGQRAFPHISQVPGPVDLAVIVTPAKTVLQIISECVEAKIPAAVIISAGFKEMGALGLAMEQQILSCARKGNMRIIGPNCLGVMSPPTGLNATFAADIALPGSIAFISQSGALCTAVLDWSLQEKVGFSAFVSIGSMVDIDWGDLIQYFGSDPATQSILLYMESMGSARSFLSAAREVALSKQIILMKAGKSAESAKAAASHTGSMAGDDDAFNAALRRVGVLRVQSIADLFSMADLLAKQSRPKGPHLTVITNAGGPGVIATDALIEEGGRLTALSSQTIEAYNELLPPHWSHNNPVDLLGDASADTYAKAIDIAYRDPHTEGILVILTPQDMTDPTRTAELLEPYAHLDKPLLASWMGAKRVAKGKESLTVCGIPTFEFPDQACKAFASMWRSADQLRGLYEVPHLSEIDAARSDRVQGLIARAQKEGRTLLDEVESKQVVEAYQIPTVPTEVAHDAQAAVRLAEKMGFPVVLKLYSRTITHKTDVGGVLLNLSHKEAVHSAFDKIFSSVKKLKGEGHFQGVTVQPMIKLDGIELILGSTIDNVFGPILLFGCGGQLVEIFQDRALGLPPLTTILARRMMEQTKIYRALAGVRGRKSIDLAELEQILVRFSMLIVEHPQIKESDINPLLASPDRLMALDARIILHPADQSSYPTPAIRPYPLQYVKDWQLRDGTSLHLRPIRPEDEPLLVQFHKELSKETVRQRYLAEQPLEKRIEHERLSKVCFIDYDREIVFVIQEKKGSAILGIGRLAKIPNQSTALLGLIIHDRWQRRGIGTKLMQMLLLAAKEENIQQILAPMLTDNQQMKTLCRSFHFSLEPQGHLVIGKLTVK